MEEKEEEKNKMEGLAKTVAPPLKKAKGLADDTVVFAEAQSEGFELKLTTLLARPEIASKLTCNTAYSLFTCPQPFVAQVKAIVFVLLEG